MKNLSTKVLVSLIMICSLVFVSCDNEEAIVQNDQEATKPESIKNYLRMVSNDQRLSVDLSWDEMTCDGIVVFTFDGTDMVFTAATEEDLELIFDEVNADGTLDVSYDDMIIISVTIAGEDGVAIELDCEEEIHDYFADCFLDIDPIDDDYDDTIECIDVIYPITLHVLNVASGDVTSFTVDNDDDLYDIFEHLNDDDIVELEYPIDLILEGDMVISVHNDDELFEVLEEAYMACYDDGTDGDDSYDDCDDCDDDGTVDGDDSTDGDGSSDDDGTDGDDCDDCDDDGTDGDDSTGGDGTDGEG